jgi:CRP-like cAMP-binding protein
MAAHSFLNLLAPDARARLLSAASEVRLRAGTHLLRRGEPGGDLYLLTEGTLEILDPTASALTVRAVLEPGVVVGQVSFLDTSPRSADVRARDAARVLRWNRQDLLALLHEDAPLAAAVYAAMSRTLAGRLRPLTEAARARDDVRVADADAELLEEARRVADRARAGLDGADTIARDPDSDPDLLATTVAAALDGLSRDLRLLFAGRPPVQSVAAAEVVLRRELRPWLNRSSFVRLATPDAGEPVVSVEAVDHVLRDTPDGEGTLGRAIDAWLLARPAFNGRRRAEAMLLARLGDGLSYGHARVLMLDALSPVRLHAVAGLLGPLEGTLVIVDPSRAALDRAEALLNNARPPVVVERVLEGVVPLALGRLPVAVERVDAVLFGHLLSYLPDRIATAVLRWAAQALAPDAHLVATITDDTHDEPVLAHLVGWRGIRRTVARVALLVAAADLDIVAQQRASGPVQLLVLRARDPAAAAPHLTDLTDALSPSETLA